MQYIKFVAASPTEQTVTVSSGTTMKTSPVATANNIVFSEIKVSQFVFIDSLLVK